MSSSIVDRDTYVLMKRFDMPVGNGTRDAIAVSSSHGLILLSFYTIMMKAIITQFWAEIVLFGVGLYLRQHSDDSQPFVATTMTGLWNMRHTPRRVVSFMAQRTIDIKSPRDLWYPFIWLAVSGIALAASLAVPIVKTQDLKLGNVAPVDPKSIFVPPLDDISISVQQRAQAFSLTVPAALRAVGAAAASVPASTVFISNSSTPSINGSDIQLSYKYGLSGSDFGLQKTPDLWLNVSGNCFTDYTWYRGVEDSTGGDVYYLWNNASDGTVIPNSSDHGPAYAINFIPYYPINGFNYTFSIIPASFGRLSFSSSTDPWYMTVPNPDNPGLPYKVDYGRPALSCWEENIWSFRGNASTIYDLHNLTGGRMSAAIATILGEYLTEPIIYTMISRLGRSNLESSTTVIESGFNANQSSLMADMTRLINTSYIATRNILSDSTTISKLGRDGLQNALLAGTLNNNTIPAGADEFVISSPEIYTLSVRVLIIVPAVLVAVLLLLLGIKLLPMPWRSLKDYVSTELKKHKAKKAKNGDNGPKEDKEAAMDKQAEQIIKALESGDNDNGNSNENDEGNGDKISSII